MKYDGPKPTALAYSKLSAEARSPVDLRYFSVSASELFMGCLNV